VKTYELTSWANASKGVAMRALQIMGISIALAACMAPMPRTNEPGAAVPVVAGPPPGVMHVEAAGARHFKPAGEAAPRYAGSPRVSVADPQLENAIEALIDAKARAAEVAPPRFDARLSAVAQDVAQFSTLAPVAPEAAVELSLAHHGLVDPMPTWIIVESSATELTDVLAVLAERLPGVMNGPPWTRVGAGRVTTTTGTRIVLGLQRTGVELQPLARRADVGKSIDLRGRLLTGYSQPQVFASRTDGRVDRLELATPPGGFATRLACAVPGERDIEIFASDEQGKPALLARFPLYCGVDAPAEVVLPGPTDAPPGPPAAIERALLTDLNSARASAGLPALTWHDRAATMAREHSESMRAREVVSHVSPAGGVIERAAAAGLAGVPVMENIGVAASEGEASLGFLLSASQRAILMSREVTHAGIGVVVARDAEGHPRLWVTEVLLRVPPKLTQHQALESAQKAFLAGRARGHAPSLLLDTSLSAIAQAYAEGLVQGAHLDDVRHDAALALDSLNQRYASTVSAELVVGNPDLLEGDRLLDAAATHYGIGLAIGPHPQLGDGAFYVVVLLARPRGGHKPLLGR
jgi:uncharacterized protein YkwD